MGAGPPKNLFFPWGPRPVYGIVFPPGRKRDGEQRKILFFSSHGGNDFQNSAVDGCAGGFWWKLFVSRPAIFLFFLASGKILFLESYFAWAFFSISFFDCGLSGRHSPQVTSMRGPGIFVPGGGAVVSSRLFRRFEKALQNTGASGGASNVPWPGGGPNSKGRDGGKTGRVMTMVFSCGP